jgi:hypothetical protein
MSSRQLSHNKKDSFFSRSEKRKRLYMQELDHQSLSVMFVEKVLPFKE